jgi:hypothetical protein
MIIGKQKKTQKSKKSPTHPSAALTRKGAFLLQKAIDELEFRENERTFLSQLLGEGKKREKSDN